MSCAVVESVSCCLIPIWLMLVPMKNHVSVPPALMSNASISRIWPTSPSLTNLNHDFPANSMSTPRAITGLFLMLAASTQSPSEPLVEFAEVKILKFESATPLCPQPLVKSVAQAQSPKDSQLIRSFVGPSPTFSAISLALLLFQFVRYPSVK